MNELVKWDAIRTQIETAKDIETLTGLKDKLRAYQILAEQSKQSQEVQAKIAIYKARADRKCGEWLRDNIKQGGDRKSKSQDATLKLKDLKLNRTESSRLQKIADIPEDKFEGILQEAEDETKKITNNMLINIAKEAERKNRVYKEAPLPKGKYQVIYADPAWDVKAGPGWGSGGESRELTYPTMTLEEIKNLPISDLADKNAHLYLWTINKYIQESYDVARAWGFEPSCLLTWIKPPHGIGLGGAFIQTTEHLLFCRRGTLETKKRIDTTWFQYPRGKHSKKPNEFRKMIEEVSPGNKIELFARQKYEGWDAWGNEI